MKHLRQITQYYYNLNYKPRLFIIPNNVSGRSFHQTVTSLQEAETAAEDDMPVNIENPYKKEPRECVLCKYKIRVDYKNTKLLSQFVSSYTGRIYDKHITGLCQQQQYIVRNAIRKAQAFGFMPFYLKEPRFLKDPELFDPFKPGRPHPH
ncbi:28S ribosomal protein S18c, mitochondrial-like [Centruroides sculpturatus]|uniref:28S ribosomal protein S18c, mitochondrial-like n=1 Tax=Centruroides sculpturatus TaxID=218467 RepID=UPI000C6CE0B2|nr:28S ribosomal protein S18c, mitochondrial-like [Centruroides sculpturatus]